MATNDIPPTLGWDDVYIVTTRDGSDTLFSRMHNATYHSLFGAVGESKHVFIQHGLKTLVDRPSISILEFGFGTGLNAFLAYLFAITTEKQTQYTGMEAYPIDSEVAQKLNYPQYLAFPEEQDIFLRMHLEDSFSSDSFHFRKLTDYAHILEDEKFDCIFFDAFAPGAQPELWEQPVFDKLFNLTTVGGCLVTYCAQGEARRRMEKAGYIVDRIPGPPGKREMLRAVRQ
ncbi:MAG: tRNA (5-methylaminomethyl-2-thiouridine)(34)-methyltransferase MnmD [Saprospiraceae bacterium]|nr:tRNA (5-methylaminomethyl-2-thiouridine)(34)-methyltransferase MnmD [Saprospiraceae bacterium]